MTETARTLDSQLKQLRAERCGRIYREKASCGQANRRELLKRVAYGASQGPTPKELAQSHNVGSRHRTLYVVTPNLLHYRCCVTSLLTHRRWSPRIARPGLLAAATPGLAPLSGVNALFSGLVLE